MALEYGKFDIKFQEERERGDKLMIELQNMEEQHKFLKSLSHKQRLEIIDYEQRYKGIDISKLHEQTRYLETQLLVS
jgi:hypothetical protein